MEKEIRQAFVMNEIAGEVKANENERTGLEMLKVLKFVEDYEAKRIYNRTLKENWSR